MCGIAGIVKEDAKTLKEQLNRMINVLQHRGPDDSGTHFFQNCALGHTRLSIVDLSTGDQPMVDENNNVGITFNGEIYGYQGIKLKLSDYQFNTASDTEVILALYHRYEEDLLSNLPGMFAFAIWDDSQKKLFCARDRFGEKPLYYAIGKNGEFIFASEIKAILATGLITPCIDYGSLIHYLRRLYVHPHKTIYENIHVLPPAHKMTYQNERLKVERYWQLPDTNDTIKMSEASLQFKQLFKQAIKRQLIADVPVGAFLSGGLDSTTITAVASKYNNNLKTFSFGFEGTLNEVPYAKEAAEDYKTEHIEVTADNVDIGELILEMAKVYDEPFADSSNIPTYLLCKLARQYGKSILTGDGADELLAGYTWWYNDLLLKDPQYTPSQLKITLTRLIASLLNKFNLPFKGRWTLKANYLEQLKNGTIIQAHYAQNIYFSDEELVKLGVDISQATNPNEYIWQESGTVDDALRMDIEDYMPGDILVKIDRASMAHGLELRAPFLDVDFASFCLTLPSRFKINLKDNKIILREAYSDLWPNSICSRDKQGFGAPVNQWLKMDSVNALKNIYLRDSKKKIFQFLSYEQSHDIVKKDNYQTWILLILSIWMEKHEFDRGGESIV